MGWQRQDHGPSVQQAIKQAAAGDHRRDRGGARRRGAPMPASTRWACARMSTSRSRIAPFRLMEALNARCGPIRSAILDLPIDGTRTIGTRRSRAVARRYDRIGSSTRRRAADLGARLAWRVLSAAGRRRDARGARAAGRAGTISPHLGPGDSRVDSPLKTLDRLDVVGDGERISVSRLGAVVPAPSGALDGRMPGAASARGNGRRTT